MHERAGIDRRRSLALGVLIATVIGCYVLATPRSGGPDEPSHMVASAALVRGDRTGLPDTNDPSLALFEVPAMVGEPNPGCWALEENIPAGCAGLEDDSTENVIAPTTSANYPPWTYVLPGLVSFIPSAGLYTFAARFAMAAIPVLLIAAALRRIRRSGRLATAAVLVGLTPIAWFSMSIVNPSAVAIAGGAALWVALLCPRTERADWLLCAGWIALTVARRDGPLWAFLIVAAVALVSQTRPSDFVRHQPISARLLVAAGSVVAPLTAISTGLIDLNLALACAPFGLIAVEVAFRLHEKAQSTRAKLAGAVGVAFAVVAIIVAGIWASPGGFDQSVWLNVVSSTGEHLRQLVGVLSWIDAPVPTVGMSAFWIAVGVLASVAALTQRRSVIGATCALLVLILVSWILEIGQGSSYGSYWQGRYSMPLFVGLPLLMVGRRPDARVAPNDLRIESLATPIAGLAWIVMNVGFVGALHRWGVGVAGSWAPQRWDTWGAPLHPILLALVHAVASAGLIVLALRRSPEVAAE